MKVKEHRNDWIVSLEKGFNLYCVIIRDEKGEIYDKIKCDTYKSAMEYWKTFNLIAKNAI